MAGLFDGSSSYFLGLFPVTHFSTAGLQANEQFDAWRSLHRDTIELLPTHKQSEGFVAEFWCWPLGELALTRVIYSSAPERQWRHRPRSYLDHWCLVLARTAAAGDELSFRSLALPYEARAQDDEVITLYIPRNQRSDDEQWLDCAHGLTLSRDFSPTIIAYIDSLIGRLPHASTERAAGLDMPTRALVAAFITAQPAYQEAAHASLNSAFIDRARTLVRQNMGSPDLGPNLLARLMGMSRSKLYRLFDEYGGVAHFINHERLHKAHQQLCDHREMSSISAIGHGVGFVDQSTFSRAFRREFGYSPSQARELSLSNILTDEAGVALATESASGLLTAPTCSERDR